MSEIFLCSCMRGTSAQIINKLSSAQFVKAASVSKHCFFLASKYALALQRDPRRAVNIAAILVWMSKQEHSLA